MSVQTRPGPRRRLPDDRFPLHERLRGQLMVSWGLEPGAAIRRLSHDIRTTRHATRETTTPIPSEACPPNETSRR